MRNKLFVLGILFSIAISCDNDDDTSLAPEDQLAKDIAAIDAYLLAHNITAIVDTTGLRYVIHKQGTGTVSPDVNNCVKADYVGKRLRDDFEFEKSLNFKFPLAGVIRGWQIGLNNMQVGDSATLYIPSGLAYGTTARGSNIGANEILYFGIQLNAIGDYYYNPARGQYDCSFIAD